MDNSILCKAKRAKAMDCKLTKEAVRDIFIYQSGAPEGMTETFTKSGYDWTDLFYSNNSVNDKVEIDAMKEQLHVDEVKKEEVKAPEEPMIKAKRKAATAVTRFLIRKLHRFEPEEVQEMCSLFNSGEIQPNRELRIQLARKFGINQRKVQVWFQNKRARLKLQHKLAISQAQQVPIVADETTYKHFSPIVVFQR